MLKAFRSKQVAILLIFSFILFYSPHLLKAQGKNGGNLIGFVYDKDGTTPLEGAFVNLRNVSTGAVHESSKTDKLGIFKIEGIDEGLYVIGLSLKEGDFNVENLIGIKANETAKVSIALKPQAKQEEKTLKGAKDGIWKFFASPIGIAVIIVASAAIVYGVVKLTEAEEEPSPFRK